MLLRATGSFQEGPVSWGWRSWGEGVQAQERRGGGGGQKHPVC